MSVMTVNNQTYVKVFNTLFINQNYNIKRIKESLGAKKLIDEIQKLHKANYESFTRSYKISDLQYEPLTIKDNDYSRFDNLFQLLKSLKCIKYNIELEPKEFDYTFIDRAIEIVKDAIIESLPEYEKAIWS